MKSILQIALKNALSALYDVNVDEKNLLVEKTKEEYFGDYTIVVFPLLRWSKKNAEDTAREIITVILKNCNLISSYNIIKGFINISVKDEFWISKLNDMFFGKKELEKKSTIMIEFSSPNTNKPLHLGHIRNNLLGDSISRIKEKAGYNVIKVNLINDRGIHICKSILAWIKWGNKQTPEQLGIKGDKFVGNYYVLFNDEYKKEIESLINSGQTKEEASNNAPLMKEARKILQRWEANDPEIMRIWKMMNEWVYEGFDITYKNLGISFDKLYYESETYLLGKEIINEGLKNNIFQRDIDNSVFIDLTAEGLDKKILLRSDGTTVYITQDIGTAIKRIEETNPEKILYVVGDEQRYHFEVLKKIIDKINPDYANKIEHISYGMVELPNGKMKSREGTVVDADDLITEMTETAKELSATLGKNSDLPIEEQDAINFKIAIAALKYYILKVDPKKQMTYNPEESIDFNGNTGPFIQYTNARINSVLRKARASNINYHNRINITTSLLEIETKLLSACFDFKEIIDIAANKNTPGMVANYIYELAKTYNQFYHDVNILNEKMKETLSLRLLLSEYVSKILVEGMGLLGIEMPESM